jgi:hypothetical protein
MAGNRLCKTTPTPPKWGRTFLFAEADPPRKEELFRDISLLADHGIALMFTMIYPFLWFLVYVHARPGSSNCRALIQRSYCVHAIGSEIIGTAFSDWAFQLLYQLGAPRRA